MLQAAQREDTGILESVRMRIAIGFEVSPVRDANRCTIRIRKMQMHAYLETDSLVVDQRQRSIVKI